MRGEFALCLCPGEGIREAVLRMGGLGELGGVAFGAEKEHIFHLVEDVESRALHGARVD